MPTPTPAVAAAPGSLLRQRTELALRIAARDVRARVDEINAGINQPDTAGEIVAATRYLTILDKRLKFMVIIAARLVHGLDWKHIGERLRLSEDDAICVYSGAVNRWIQGDPAPWAPRVDGATVTGVHPIDITADNLAEMAAEMSMSTYPGP